MGDESRDETYERWLRTFMGLILKVVRSNCETSADRDDLLQEIFVNLWISLPNFQRRSAESTWIYKVSLHTAIVWKRSENKRHLRVKGLRFDIAHHNCDPDDGNQFEELYAAIRKLSKIDASVAIMHLDGLSYQEMSDVLGIFDCECGQYRTCSTAHHHGTDKLGLAD